MSNFWKDLPPRFVGLSPMDGVTDFPFREIQAQHAKPAVMYTEFNCVEGITHGATRLLKDFLFSAHQRPIVAQIYGHTPADFRTVTVIVCQLGFDGVDINMGCPAKNVTHLGSGAALIRTPKLAQEIIQAVKDGVNDWVNGRTVDDLTLSDEIKHHIRTQTQANLDTNRHPLPVSVKTRIGFDVPVIHEWIGNLLEMEPAAIAVHGRMLKQYYGGEANWDEIARAKELAKGTQTLIMGNGDVKNLTEAKQRFEHTQVDGILLGRAAMGNPWIFTEHEANTDERFQVAIEHSELYEKSFFTDEKYSFIPMRKHLGWYVKDFPGASELRQRLVQTNSAAEVREILENSR